MFKTAVWTQDYDQWAHNAKACITLAVQWFARKISKWNCKVCSLLTTTWAQTHHLKLMQGVYVPPARSAKLFVAHCELISSYGYSMHPVALLSKLSHNLIEVNIGLYKTRAHFFKMLSDNTDFSNSCNVSVCRPQTRQWCSVAKNCKTTTCS